MPRGGARDAVQHPGTETGGVSASRAGGQIGLRVAQRRMWMYCLDELGFSTCFCGDGNPPGGIINCGLSRKLVFQSLVFSVLLPPGLVRL